MRRLEHLALIDESIDIWYVAMDKKPGSLLPASITGGGGQNVFQLEMAVRERLFGDCGSDSQKVSSTNQRVESVDGYFQNEKRTLKFRLDELSGGVAIMVVDSEDSKLIRYISSEQALKLIGCILAASAIDRSELGSMPPDEWQ